eukprot:2885095-Rhodomonas_salina.1
MCIRDSSSMTKEGMFRGPHANVRVMLCRKRWRSATSRSGLGWNLNAFNGFGPPAVNLTESVHTGSRRYRYWRQPETHQLRRRLGLGAGTWNTCRPGTSSSSWT